MQTVDVGASADAAVSVSDSNAPLPPIGFDLDNDCTCCNAEAGSVCPTGGSCIGSSVICDDNAGRDHIALNIFREVPNASAAASAGMQAGQFSILLQIGGYNGRPNDTNVAVALYVSNGIDGVEDGGRVTPRHDGTNLWTVDAHYLATTQTGGTVSEGTECNGTSACQPIYADHSVRHQWRAGLATIRHSTAHVRLPREHRRGTHAAERRRHFGHADAEPGRGRSETLGDHEWLDLGPVGERAASRQPGEPPVSERRRVLRLRNGFPRRARSTRASRRTSVDSRRRVVPGPRQHDADVRRTIDEFGFTAEPALLGTVFSVSPPPSGCQTEAGLWSDMCQ